MHRGQDPTTVLEDVDLHPGQEAERSPLFVDLDHDLELLTQTLLAEPVRQVSRAE